MTNASEARARWLVRLQDSENAILISDNEPYMNAYAAMPSGGHMARFWLLGGPHGVLLGHACHLARYDRNQARLGVRAFWQFDASEEFEFRVARHSPAVVFDRTSSTGNVPCSEVTLQAHRYLMPGALVAVYNWRDHRKFKRSKNAALRVASSPSIVPPSSSMTYGFRAGWLLSLSRYSR